MDPSDYNEIVDIKRLADDSGNTESYYPHLSDVPCLVQTLDDSFSLDIDGSFGKDWLMICDTIDTKEGDIVSRSCGDFRVVAAERLEDYGGEDGHMELRIREFKK